MGTSGTLYWPASPVSVVRVRPVAWFFTVTFAWGMGARLWSITVPTIAPRKVWARNAGTANVRTTIAIAAGRAERLPRPAEGPRLTAIPSFRAARFIVFSVNQAKPCGKDRTSDRLRLPVND